MAESNLNPENPVEGDADRYARQRLIDDWDQTRLAQAVVMVVGAGALGNEVLKNLALLGIGKILIVDLDRVEVSNLSRAVLFRPEDAGQFKAQVAARRLQELNPEVQAQAFTGNVVWQLGLGVFRRVDVVIGCLDNREARWAVNRSCRRLGIPWVDGGLGGFDPFVGSVKVFLPGQGACYECGMGEADWVDIGAGWSCRQAAQRNPGHIPTLITTTAIIAGVQVQEALKILQGRPSAPGSVFMYDGIHGEGQLMTLAERGDCLAHQLFEPVVELLAGIQTATFADVLLAAQQRLGPEAWIELEIPLLLNWVCPECGQVEPVTHLLPHRTPDGPACPACGETRVPQLAYTLQAGQAGLGASLVQAGVPALQIFKARSRDRVAYFELNEDLAGYFSWQGGKNNHVDTH